MTGGDKEGSVSRFEVKKNKFNIKKVLGHVSETFSYLLISVEGPRTLWGMLS